MVITGGTSLLDGIVEFAQQRYGIPVRRGRIPQGIHGLRDIVESPIYATAIGLLKYAVEGRDFALARPRTRARASGGFFSRLLNWFRKFLRG